MIEVDRERTWRDAPLRYFSALKSTSRSALSVFEDIGGGCGGEDLAVPCSVSMSMAPMQAAKISRGYNCRVVHARGSGLSARPGSWDLDKRRN
jgi:hypothetical protein